MNNIITFIIIYYLLGIISQILGFLTGKVISMDGVEKTDNYIDNIGKFVFFDIFLWFANPFIILYYGIKEEEPKLIIGGLSLLLPPIKIIVSIYIIIKNRINK